MKKIKFTTTKLLIFVMVLALFTLAACSNNTTPSSSATTSPSDSNIITLEEISSKAAGYYPDEVSFQFVRQDRITDEANQDGFVDQECYLFDVIFEGKKISGIAVGVEDSSIWILDMNADNLWLSESFMGLPRSVDSEVIKREPVVEFIDRGENGGEAYLYFAHLDAIPELSNQNEGSVRWNETEKTLTIGAVKATGSVTGAIDGPSVQAVVTWKDGEPELVSVEYEPAPTFSHPSQVLLSGETMNIETGRLIEIAEYFRALMREKLNGISTPAIQPEPQNAAPIVTYVAYDYMGLSHKAVITDAALIQRILDCFNYPGDGTEKANPTMGGAVGISIEDGNTVKEFLFTSASNGEDVMYQDNFSSVNYYYLKDETLVKDLTDTYHNDNNKVTPIPKDEMSIAFVYFDYVEKDMVIQGEEGRTELAPGDDMERLKTVIASDISYKNPVKDPCLVGGEGIQIDTVISSREFRSYYLFKLQDGTVVCRFNYGMSDEPLTEDRTFYVVSDTKVYDYIISTYFANINPTYSTQ